MRRRGKIGRYYENFAAHLRWSPSGCLLWTGALSSEGYGKMWNGTKTVLAHRFSYEAFRGEIGEGMQLDHLCRVHNCVHPYHLESVTSRENLMRGFGASALNAVKTHCKRGHPFTVENTYIRPKGQRLCRTCRIVRGEVRGRSSV